MSSLPAWNRSPFQWICACGHYNDFGSVTCSFCGEAERTPKKAPATSPSADQAAAQAALADFRRKQAK